MPLTLIPSTRYDMPASFGPSVVPDRTVARAEAMVLSGATSREAVEALLPGHFSVPERPVLTIAHMAYHDVDYLGGRSYNEIVVTVGVSFDAAGEGRTDAGVALALWVDQPGALIAGREYMGLPKILGFISDLDGDGSDYRFVSGEYDTVLIEGSVAGLREMDADRLARLNDRAGEVRTFGWKFIAGPAGTIDVDYPLVNVMRWTYDRAWTGTGDVRFIPPAFADAPMSAAAIKAMAALEIERPMRAFRGVGRATIDRTATRRLSAA